MMHKIQFANKFIQEDVTNCSEIVAVTDDVLGHSCTCYQSECVVFFFVFISIP